MKIWGTGLALIAIILSGLWISSTGKPFNTLIFTVHKLVAVGIVVFLIVTMYQLNKVGHLSLMGLVAGTLTIVLLVAAAVTGGLLSIELETPPYVLRIHQIIPMLIIASSGLSLYLLVVKSQVVLE